MPSKTDDRFTAAVSGGRQSMSGVLAGKVLERADDLVDAAVFISQRVAERGVAELRLVRPIAVHRVERRMQMFARVEEVDDLLADGSASDERYAQLSAAPSATFTSLRSGRRARIADDVALRFHPPRVQLALELLERPRPRLRPHPRSFEELAELLQRRRTRLLQVTRGRSRDRHSARALHVADNARQIAQIPSVLAVTVGSPSCR